MLASMMSRSTRSAGVSRSAFARPMRFIVVSIASTGCRGGPRGSGRRIGILDQAKRLEVVGGVALEGGAALQAIDEMADRTVEARLVGLGEVVADGARGRPEDVELLGV